MQAIRHEWITVLILQMPEIRAWLRRAEGFEGIDWPVLEWVVSGHHPKYMRPSPPSKAPDNCGATDIHVLLGHPDFRICLDQLDPWFRVGRFPATLSNKPFNLRETGEAFVSLTRFKIDGCKTWNGLSPALQKLAVTVCREVEEVVTERVPCRVAVRVPYTVSVPVVVCDCPDGLD